MENRSMQWEVSFSKSNWPCKRKLLKDAWDNSLLYTWDLEGMEAELIGPTRKDLEPSSTTGTPKSWGKPPADSKIFKGKQLPSFSNTLMLVLNILLSDLNSCCSVKWNRSASDGYHYKIWSIKYSHEYRTQNHFIWLIKSIFAISIYGRRATLSSFTSRQVKITKVTWLARFQ